MIIMKFGGTSVGNPPAIKQVVHIIQERLAKKPVVVTSALAHVTNILLATADLAAQEKRREVAARVAEIAKRHHEVISGFKKESRGEIIAEVTRLLEQLEETLAYIIHSRTVSKEDRDAVASFGERLSSWLLTGALRDAGLRAQRIDSREIVVTDSDFGGAEVDMAKTKQNFSKKILPLIKKGIVPVITGYIGQDANGNTTTLGRGGSDYTAAIAAVSLNAAEIQIWKDVKGFMTADPRTVHAAHVIPRLSFKEAAELAYFGAKVLHPKTIHPAILKKIPVRILNTFDPKNSGTLIYGESNGAGKGAGTSAKKMPVAAIAFKKGITVINICSLRMLGPYGFLEQLFRIFSQHRVPVDVVTTTEVSVSMTIEDDALQQGLIDDLKKIGTVDVRRSHAILSLVGHGLKADPRVEAGIFDTLCKAGISTEMVSKGASAINITCIIEERHAEKAVLALHKKFFV